MRHFVMVAAFVVAIFAGAATLWAADECPEGKTFDVEKNKCVNIKGTSGTGSYPSTPPIGPNTTQYSAR